MTPHPADRLAFDKAMVTQPVWNHFATTRDVTELSENVLLHAGPQFQNAGAITRPIRNSACVAAVYEGIARDFDAAEAMIDAGEIELRPAQDFGVVTPLAAVVSASMPLHGVYDAWRGQDRCYAPINGGNRPSLRLGLRSDAVLSHIRWLNTRCLDALQRGLAEGIALVPLAVDGLRGGDDCHGRTPVAGSALVEELNNRSRGGINDSEVLAFLRGSPSIFLNLWMAATKLMMTRAQGIPNSGFVTAAGGNGRHIGVQISGLPGHWFTIPATPPEGDLDVDLPKSRALGAIGDSAVVDVFGLGAMADIRGGLSELDARQSLSIGEHPYFRKLGVRLGSSARGFVKSGTGPTISLGIIDREGTAGRLGGGRYHMPVTPFERAMQELPLD